MWIGGIVSRSQRIDACRLEEKKTSRPNRFGHGRPQRTCVMMNADPLQFHRLSVQVETCVAVKTDSSQSDTHIPHVGCSAALQNGTSQFVQHGRIRRPELRPTNGQLEFTGFPQSLTRSHLPARGICQGKGCTVAAQSFVPNRDLGFFLIGRQSVGKDTVYGKTYGVADLQQYVTIDAAAGEPTGIRHFIVLHADAKHILAGTDKRGDIMSKGSIAVWTFAKVVTVDPYAGMFIHAVEGDTYPLTRHTFRHGEVLAIPGGAARQIACAASVAEIKGMLH